MKIDLTCPVELWHYALPTEQYPVCRLQLFNLTEKTVVSVQAIFSCYDQTGTLSSRQVERVQGLSGPSRSAFELAVVVENGAHAAGMDFSIEKVWFDDGTVWRHSAEHISEFTPNPLYDAHRLEVLRSLAGADAAGYPTDQGAVWTCVCGRPNAAASDTCRRCGRSKQEVFKRFNEATVETVIFERENAAEEADRQARESARRQAEEEDMVRRKKRRARRRVVGTIIGLLLVAVLAFGVYFHGIPFYKFYTAERQLENGVYTTARTTFEELAAQRGVRSLPVKIEAVGLDVDLMDMQLYYRSAELAQECTYRQAGETMAVGTIPALRTAQDAFETLGDYRDSATQAKETRYRRAGLLAASKQYESAVALYGEITSYRDSAAQRSMVIYQWASQLMEAFDYAGAREKFLTLGNYSDSARRAQLCLYQPALDAIETGDYLRAIELLTQLDAGFESTAVRLQEAYYGAAGDFFAAQDYETAAEYYLLAGDYLDAYLQAAACLYEPAVALFEEGNYIEAKAAFDKIPAYKDALTYSWRCCAALGEAAMDAGDYETARAYLGEALDYEPAQALFLEATYLPAAALQEAGDPNGALELFETILGYRDADERIRSIRYEQAIELMNSRDYAAAAEAFEALGDYRESAEEALNARYGYAMQLLDNGEYTEAIAAFEALDGYLSSANAIQRAQYGLGTDALAEGDTAAAAEYFRLAGDYEDAPELFESSIYKMALEALDAGESEKAAALLEQIPDYADADMLRRESVYRTAENLQEAGDLSQAAKLFASISGHEDAAERAAACYDAYYAEAYNTAKAAMERKDYSTAIAALESVSRENAGMAYADIEHMYKEANYQYANRLFEDKKPYEALVYYRHIPDYRDVAQKLDRVCYRILGRWESVTGVHMEFREDGTCTINGRDYYFRATTYAFYAGDRPDEMVNEWTIYSCTEKALSIMNNRTKAQYKLTRITE